MENGNEPLPTSPVPEQPSASQTTPPSVTETGIPLPQQPVTESLLKTQTPQPANKPLVPDTSEEKQLPPKKNHWVAIAVGVFVFIAITGAAAYFGGFLNPTSGNEQLNGSAQQVSQQTPAQNFTEQLGGTEQTAVQNQTQENFLALTQSIPNACPQGEVMDPVSSRCACDINNNYFELSIPGAYAQPTAGISSVACTTCAALSDQILKLGQSNDPIDATRKTELQAIAEQNNCTPCAVYDDRINEASQNQQWDKFFQLVVQKSQDKTCGRTLPTCDSLKWQLLFLNQLRDRAGKDPQTAPEMLQNLQDLQQSLTEDLGNNAACYDMQNLCSELKMTYGNVPQAITTQQIISTPVTSAPLIGQNSNSGSQQTEQIFSGLSQQFLGTSEQSAPTINLQTNLQDQSQINFDSIKSNQLFDKQYYLLHCPVEDQTSTAPVKKVKRVQTVSP